MIAACPKCQTRYRIRPEQVNEKGMRLRCRRCESIFRVRPPAAEAVAPAPVPAPTETPVERELAAPERAKAPEAPPPPPSPRAARESLGSLVVAHENLDEAKAICESLVSLALSGTALSDGVEALLTIQRTQPSAVVLGVELARMNGHEICELMKRNESLRQIPIILLGGAARGDFCADRSLEADPGSALAEALVELGIGEPEAEDEHAGAPPIAAAASDLGGGLDGPTTTEQEPAAAPLPASGSAVEEALERAERLARIAISDIVLYNEEKFDAALRSGDVLSGMRDEVEEGRALLRDRIDPDVFAQRDFIADELLRVAERRGA